MARRSRINPLQMGLMGAFLGGLQFKLNEHLENIRLQAEAAKEARLEAIMRDREARENAEWTRRTEMQHENEVVRDQLDFMRQKRLQEGGFAFRAEEAGKEREHDVRMEGLRTGNNMDQLEFASNLREEEAGMEARLRETAAERDARRGRREHAWQSAYDAEFNKRTGGARGSDKGVLGSDGRFYPFGANLPPGVEVKMSYGGTFAPSASKSGTPAGGHRGQRATVPATAPAPARPAAPAGMPEPKTQAEYAQLPSGTTYKAPDGSIRVKP